MDKKALLRVYICLGLSSLIVYSLPVNAAEDNMQVLAKAWKERQERVRSMQFTWTETRLHPRGIAPFVKGDDQRVRPKDMSYNVYHRLVIDGEKMRYSYDGKTWKQDMMDVTDMNHISVFDGQTPKLLDKGVGLDYPIGAVLRDQRSPDVTQLQNIPVLLCYRAANPTMSPITLANYSVSSEKATINGRLCIVLKEHPGLHNGVISIYVDPERGYSIMRYTIGVNGNVQVQLDLKYSSDSDSGWVPASWELALQSPSGLLQQHSQSSVTISKINPSIPPGEFQLDFPVGAWITDQRTKRDNGDYVSFLVRSDGTERVVRENEVTVPHDQLMKTESRGILTARWFIIINFIVLMTVVGYFLWKIVKKTRRAASP